MRQRRAHDQAVLLAVADAAVILAPIHFSGVGRQIRAGDLVMNADLRAAQTGEEAFRLIGRSAVVAIGHGVVDALGHVARMESIPMGSFVGKDGAAQRDAIMQAAHAFIFALGHEGQRLAVALARHDHDLALARLVLCAATVNAMPFVVGGANVATRVHAVDFDFARNLDALIGSRHRLTQLVRQDESRLVLAVEIARELERAMALRTVNEDGDSGE